MATTTMNFTIDENVKTSFENVASQLGISSSALLNLLAKRVVDEQGIPFQPKVIYAKPDEEYARLADQIREQAKKLPVVSVSTAHEWEEVFDDEY